MKNKKNRKKLEELNEQKTTAIIEQIFPLISLQRNTSFMIACIFYYHPFINPIVNPADILPVNGIPKLVIANEEEAVAVRGGRCCKYSSSYYTPTLDLEESYHVIEHIVKPRNLVAGYLAMRK